MARGLRTRRGMTLVISRRVKQRRRRAWMTEPAVGSPMVADTARRWDFAAPRSRRHGRKAAPPRLGLLRVAPRLTVVTGNRKATDWPAIANGIRAAAASPGEFEPRNGFDPEDAPSCA